MKSVHIKNNFLSIKMFPSFFILWKNLPFLLLKTSSSSTISREFPWNNSGIKEPSEEYGIGISKNKLIVGTKSTYKNVSEKKERWVSEKINEKKINNWTDV